MRYLTFTIVCMGVASCAFESARVPDFDFFHVSDSKEWIAVKSLPPDVLGNMNATFTITYPVLTEVTRFYCLPWRIEVHLRSLADRKFTTFRGMLANGIVLFLC